MTTVAALRLFAASLAAAGAFVFVQGVQLKIYGILGPGPGFFPVAIGAALVIGAIVLFLRAGREPSAPFFESADGRGRIARVVVALALLGLGLELVGFRLAVFAFVLAVPRIIGFRRPIATLALAVILGFGVATVFERLLGVALPAPAIEALADLGF